MMMMKNSERETTKDDIKSKQINRFRCAFKHYNCTFFIVISTIIYTTNKKYSRISHLIDGWMDDQEEKEKEKPKTDDISFLFQTIRGRCKYIYFFAIDHIEKKE
jgi:hypothetical protein